jgi:hypothetical protein
MAIEAPSTLRWSATLSGFDLNRDGRLTYTLIDATGSGSGWSLTASATPLTAHTSASGLPTGKRMHKPYVVNGSATTALSSARPRPTCATGSTCTLPGYQKIAYPVSVPICTGANTGSTCTPATLAIAPPTTGLGAVVCTTDWWLTIPANTFAGLYTDTITLSLSSGP